MMRGARFWQSLVVVLLTVMVTLNLRILLMGGNGDEPDSSLDSLRGATRELCERPLIVNINEQARVSRLNASFAHVDWLSIKPGQAKVIGFSRQTKGFLTIGIPSIKRINGMSYLVETVASIIDKTTTRDKTEVVIVVFLADFDADYNADVVKTLTTKYMDYVNMGFLQIVQVSKDFYPPLTGLKRNFNDKEERVTWRSKQVADFAFMFLYAQNLSQYYIQIEDDVMCATSFINAIREYIKSMGTNQWAILEFSELGFIGKLLRSSDLEKLARYLLTFYDEQPVDWLISFFRMSMAQRKVFLRKPTLFQHIGLKSSFDTSKDNPLKDKFFDSGDKPWKSDDPQGVVISNMVPFEQWLPSLCYGSGSGFFWASGVKTGDWLTVVFDQDVKLQRVVVETGHPKTHKDVLVNGSLEISPKLLKMDEKNKKVTCVGFRKIATFQSGRLDVANVQSIVPGTTKCLRLTVGDGQKDWVVFNQIAIYEEHLADQIDNSR